MPYPDPITPAAAPAAGNPLVLALIANRDGLAAYIDRQLPAALRRTIDPADVLHDACCEALLHEADFLAHDESSGRRWLYTIARNRITHLLRQRRTARLSPVGGADGTAGAGGADADPLVRLLGELAVYERTPSQSAVSHETWATVQRSLGRLRPEYQSVIRSRYLDRLPAAEVASRTGRTAHAVEQSLHRAMTALRTDLRSLITAHAC